MSDQNNPYGSPASGYAPNITLGGASSAGAPAAAPEAVKDVTTASFAADVIQESRKRPVLVDFWAPWCGPCKQLAPVLEKVVAEARGAVRLVKMNIDEHPSIAGQLGIQSIPAVIVFRDGQPVDGFMGAVPESQIRDLIKRLGADPSTNEIGEAIDAARAALDEGDSEAAKQIFAMVLEAEPGNAGALEGLATLALDDGDLDSAEEIIGRVPDDKASLPEVAGVKARLAVARETAAIGDPAAIEARLASDPGDHQARFDLAMIQNARGERIEAAESLLAIMKADRSWNDDGARAQLLRFFEAWGMTDEATLAARRKLSSLLFS